MSIWNSSPQRELTTNPLSGKLGADHPALLRPTAAAEALPACLEHAAAENLGHTAFLERLLDVEVTATDARRRASLERFASLPSPFRLEDFDFDAQPGIDKH